MTKKQGQSTTSNDPKSRVAVGLSGGVDSSLAAALLVEQGYEVTGVFLECWKEPGCRAEEDRKDALAVALKLRIPFVVLDFRKEYKERVVEYFYREYEAGRTPNPDTVCNREIKFGLFYEWTMKEGYDFVATGHYARIQKLQVTSYKLQDGVARDSSSVAQNDGMVLMRGRDVGKDQSYFLYQIRGEQLEHVLLPIGGMLKSEVREEAKKRGLATADKPDSQGICFIGEVDVRKLLKERIGEKPGEVVMRLDDGAREKIDKGETKMKTTFERVRVVDGNEVVVGKHKGIFLYTVGQRVGEVVDKKILKRLFEEEWFASDPTEMSPMFVVEKEVESNRLVVGFEEETYKSRFVVGDINWLSTKHQAPHLRQGFGGRASTKNVWVRIRNLGELVEARVWLESSGIEERLIVTLSRPMRGVAEGQACVFYSDDSEEAMVLGGGIIACSRSV